LLAGCNRTAPKPPAPAREPADTQVRALADAYLDGFFQRNPDQIKLFGVPVRRHDALPDNSLEALKAWQAKEDGWLEQVRGIDPATIESGSLPATSAHVPQRLAPATR